MKRGCPKSAARWTPKLKKFKAMSIRQPWAWLIVNGYKDVENRIWAANLSSPSLKQGMMQELLTGRTRFI
jgi:hypothetical protein